MNTVNVTREGEKKLREELKYLKEERRPKIIEALKEARRKGDLTENAEFDSARDEQRLVESRITQIEVMIRNIRIIDDTKMPDDKVYIGARVELEDIDSGNELYYIIVNEIEADFKERKISTVSPIGKGLLGKGVGDTVEITIPMGTLRYKITGISR